MYNYDYIVEYKTESDDIYREQFLNVFSLKQYDNTVILNTLNEINLKYKNNLEFINLIEKSKKKYNEEVSIYAMMFLFSWDNFDLFHNCLRCFNDNILNSTHYNILFNNLT